jgi:hypothetical protein
VADAGDLMATLQSVPAALHQAVLEALATRRLLEPRVVDLLSEHCLSGATALELQFDTLSDERLARWLSRVERLERANLSSCYALRSLAPLLPHRASLQELRLNRCRRMAPSPAELSALTALQALELSGTALSSLQGLEALPQLLRLDVSSTACSDGLAAVCANASSLAYLSLSCCKFRQLDALRALAQLRELHLSYLPHCDTRAFASLDWATSFPALAVLDLSRNHAVDDEVVGALVGLPRLESLCLAHTSVTDACGPALARLSTLSHLDVCYTDVGDAAARVALPALPRLESLVISFTRVSGAAVAACAPLLRNLRRFKAVHVSARQIDDESLANIAHGRWDRLEQLDVGGRAITDDSVPLLRDFGALRRVSFWSTSITIGAVLRLHGDQWRLDESMTASAGTYILHCVV